MAGQGRAGAQPYAARDRRGSDLRPDPRRSTVRGAGAASRSAERPSRAAGGHCQGRRQVVTLPAGTRLGRYEIRAPLGKGGMGEVYLAHDPELGRPVALKLLPPEVAADAERMRRFAQEAKAASALNHPNILTIYEVGGADSARFIASEFVDGVTLRERLAGRPIALDEALDIALQAASALAAAHAAGIVHRDVKPENLMIRPDGWVKVLDFGLAKLAPPAAELGDAPTQTGLATEAGVVMGTARYMSPEQACGLAVDARTDVWSLGVVLYEMIAGRLPFPGTTSGEVLAAVLQQPDPLPLARFTPNVPPDLERFVSRALARKREERYQAMHDLALDLKGLKQRREFEREARRSSSSASSAGSPPASDPVGLAEAAPSSRPVRRRRRLSLAVATGGLAAAILAGVLYLRPSGSASATVESLAVLPLAVAGGDSDTEFLSEGLAENMINSLSQVPGLKVIARSSAFRYQGSEVRSEEHTSELQSQSNLVCRLLLEKKKSTNQRRHRSPTGYSRTGLLIETPSSDCLRSHSPCYSQRCPIFASLP